MTKLQEAHIQSMCAGAGTLDELGNILAGALSEHIGFDRLNIGLLDLERYVFVDAFVHGQNVSGRAVGHERTLNGTVVEAALREDGAFAFGSSDLAAWLAQFPRFEPVFMSGMRAMLAIPLRAGNGQVHAVLVLASHDPDAFGASSIADAEMAARAVAKDVKRLGASGITQP